MSSTTKCRECGGVEVEKDATGTVCTNCGAVLEEGALVAEVEFLETGAGGHAALGQFVSADAPSKLPIGTIPGVHTKESREVTLQRARRLINEVGSQLRLNQHCLDTAFNFVKMAIARGITRGRQSTHVIAACLYITCRLEGTPHLLLDFSEVLQVNLYELGKTYTFMARTLYINLAPTDPCLYVMRFAHRLNFGEKEHEVATLAIRLVKRMDLDYIATGRRPSGLCGAALLLAARYYNFNRTVNDIIQVVSIYESVVRKRLEEFACTPSGELTLEEFLTVDLEQRCDPPSFRAARHKAEQKQMQQQAQQEDMSARLQSMEKELRATEAVVEEALSAAARPLRGAYAQYAKDKPESAISILGLNFRNLSTEDSREAHDAASFVEEQLMPDILPEDVQTRDSDGEQRTLAERFREFRPTLASLGIEKTVCNDASDKAVTSSQGQEDSEFLDDIDDEEISAYLLTADEVKLKTEMWNSNYEEYMQAVEEKRRLKEEERLREEQEGLASGKKKRQSRTARKKPTEAATASEAIEMILQEKKLSNKINYEVLKALNEECAPSTSNVVEKSAATQHTVTAISLSRFGNSALLKRPPVASDMTPAAAAREPLCKQKQHAKVLEKGIPDDAMPGIKNSRDALPFHPISGLINKDSNKVRLTFKLEVDQLWIGTKERTDKIPINQIKNVVSAPIEGHEEYHIMGLQLGPTEASRYWLYWVPAQYIAAIKEATMGS